APFKFYRDQPRTLALEATVAAGTGDELVAHCRLVGSRQLANQPEPQVITHFTGRVRLSPATAEPSTAAVPSAPHQGGVGAEAIYRVYFHGPAYQVLERSWREGDRQVGLLAAGLPEHHQPPGLPLVTAPRLLELCFQTAGVWELGTSGRLALPRHLGRVTIMAAGEPPTGRVFAVVTPGAGGETFDAMVVDEAGRVHLRLEGYATVALPTPLDAALLAPLRPEVT
ncbi:MAG: polyketide synthase dehydratase domain-containing protein, partial [Actinomycetes bacterium]